MSQLHLSLLGTPVVKHGAQQGIMASQGSTHRLGILFPAGGATFNIGEEERDCSCG